MANGACKVKGASKGEERLLGGVPCCCLGEEGTRSQSGMVCKVGTAVRTFCTRFAVVLMYSSKGQK